MIKIVSFLCEKTDYLFHTAGSLELESILRVAFNLTGTRGLRQDRTDLKARLRYVGRNLD